MALGSHAQWGSGWSVAALFVVGVGCGTSAPSEAKPALSQRDAAPPDAAVPAKPPANSGLGTLVFRPAILYSGYDGVHDFTVPIAVYDAGDDLSVSADDAAAIVVEPKKLENPVSEDGFEDAGRYFFLKVKRSGTFKVRAKSGGKEATATVNVAVYTSQKWAAGEARYTKAGSDGSPACTTCHVDGKAIDNSPAALATATDAEIASVISTGISTDNFPIKIDGQPGHRWTSNEAELEGLVTYLRSLTPRGFK